MLRSLRNIIKIASKNEFYVMLEAGVGGWGLGIGDWSRLISPHPQMHLLRGRQGARTGRPVQRQAQAGEWRAV